MAQRRMLDKKISLSEKVAGLDLLGQLLYTWMIPHSDDFGLLQASPRTIKALVVPMLDKTTEEVGFQLETMRNTGLVLEITIIGKKYYKIVGSENNQTLKKDRQPQTIIEIKPSENKEQSWKDCQKLVSDAISITYGNQTETIGNQTVPELKGTEEKINNNGKSAEAPLIKKNETMKTTNGIKSIGEIMGKKVFLSKEEPKSGIYTEWQEKAFRYATDLNITLGTRAKGRWLKMFKQASLGRKSENIEKAYSFIIDYPKPMSSEQKLMFFFKIYECGKEWMKNE